MPEAELRTGAFAASLLEGVDQVVISPGQVEGEEVITLQALEGHVEGVVAGQPVSIEEGQTRSAINDRTPPTIQLQKPSAATYLVGEAVAVAYICADAASFVVSCTGSAPNGVALDTRAPGVYTFEIVAVDTAGNQSSKTVQYTVSYGVRLLYDPTKIVKSGSTLPIKLQIVDAQGNNRSSSVLALQAVGVQMISSQVAGEVEDAGNANPDWTFRYNADTEGFIYNLKTTGLLTGTYDLRFSIIADPQLHRAKFQVR